MNHMCFGLPFRPTHSGARERIWPASWHHHCDPDGSKSLPNMPRFPKSADESPPIAVFECLKQMRENCSNPKLRLFKPNVRRERLSSTRRGSLHVSHHRGRHLYTNRQLRQCHSLSPGADPVWNDNPVWENYECNAGYNCHQISLNNFIVLSLFEAINPTSMLVARI